MTRYALICTLTLAIGGCATTQTAQTTNSNRTMIAGGPEISLMPMSNRIALATLEPAGASTAAYHGPAYHLGAGDSLGQAIYVNYAMIARANAGWQYAAVDVNN